jgi:hypothetical protein
MTVLKKSCIHSKGENHLLEAVLPFCKLKVKLVIGRARVMRINLPVVLKEGNGSATTAEGSVGNIL